MRSWCILLALALAAVPTLAGCLEDAGGGPPGGSDADPLEPLPLVAYGEYHYHSGTAGVHLAPNASEPGPAPASCVAYRNDTVAEDGSCEVRAEEEELPAAPGEDARTVPWTLRAEWADGVSENAWRVLAFDAANETVARWDGNFTGFAWYATE